MERALKRQAITRTKILTFDEILAFDVETYNEEKSRVIDGIDNFLKNPLVKETIIGAKVAPICLNLQTWLNLFSDNMRDKEVRLKGMDSVRVCFAEKAMTMMMDLAKEMAIIYNMTAVSRNEKQSTNIKEMLRYLSNILNPVNQEEGLKFIICYLNTLVDVTPLSLRSSTTPLTTKNIEYIKKVFSAFSNS